MSLKLLYLGLELSLCRIHQSGINTTINYSLLLIIVLGIGFLGYLTPGMRVNWETIATMCGF